MIARVAAALIALSLSAASSAAAQSTCHTARVDGDVIRWHTSAPSHVTLTLPRELEVIRVEGATLRDREVVPSRTSSRAQVYAVQRIVDRSEVTLRPPRTTTPQRILLSGPDGTRFEPVFDGVLERRLGLIRAEDVEAYDVRQLDAQCGASRTAERIYLGPGPAAIRGAIHTRGERRGPTILVGAIVLLFSLVAGVRAYKKLAQRAALERADALIDERFEALGRDPPE